MKTSVKKLTDTKVELTVKVDKKALDDAKLVALRRIASDLKVPGFRKGKVPVDVAKKHADPNLVAEQTANMAVNKAAAEAFMSENIRPISQPQIELVKYVPEQELEFKATADIFPEVKLGDYKKLKAKREKVTVADAKVDDVLKNIQNSFAEVSVVKRAAKLGDEVQIDFTGKKDGVEFDGGKAKDHKLELGSNSFIPGFEDAIVGHEAGDKFDIPLTFPKDYHNKELAGAKVVFEVLLKQVNARTVPDIDDKLAAKCGPFKTLEALKSDVKNNLTVQKENQAVDKLKDDLVSELVKTSKVPVPEVLVEDQAKQIRFDMEQNLAYRGMKLDDYLAQTGKTEEEWLKTDVQQAAEQRVKAGLVLAELSKELKIDVTDSEIDERLEQFKQQYQKDEKVLAQLGTEQTRIDIRNSLLTDKTVTKLLEVTGN
ncbi:MAG: trigger factor [Candidatus Nomurabacteria bacterium]|jgi:trigger factor|nr:trigger factor [Candidatus Nomurabacteria bacterium]